MNVGSLLHYWAKYRPNHTALVCGPHRLTFAEYELRIHRVANAFRALGLKKGDKLAIVLPNCIELLDAYRAAALLGVVLVPLSPLLRGPGLVSLLSDSDAAAVFSCAAMVDVLDEARRGLPQLPRARWVLIDAATPGYRDYAELLASVSADPPPAVDIENDDTFNIIYSSGTTGQPKGIVHTNYIRGMYCTLFANAFRFRHESVVMHAGSMVFNGAFVTLLPAWLLGCTFVLQERFDPAAFIDAVQRERVTHVMTVPSQIVALLGAGNFSARALKTLEMFCSVGAPLHREHKERLLQVLPNSLYELYGLTEGFVTILDRAEFASHIDSVGKPALFNEMRIVNGEGQHAAPNEIGEIVGRSPFLMPGYYKRPDLTAQTIVDGWLHTGDLGYADAEGFLHLVDRKKDLIISGGVNVYPKDIEEVAVTHPAVREAAVFGVPSEKWGEAAVAAVVLSTAGAATEEELRQWINARVAARYQRLHHVTILQELPRNVAGKTLKRVLRERFSMPKLS